MYVCSCRVVSDSTIEEVIEAGATSIEDIARECGAGSRCGGCWPTLMALIEDIEAKSAPLLDLTA